MKIRIITLLGAASFALSQAAFSQGNFQNLDFESASLPVLPSGQYAYVTTSAGIPGWTVYYGDQQQMQIVQNGISTGASLDILGPNFSGTIIDGNYSVLLQSGATGAGLVSTSIAQTGTLPQGSEIMLFKAALSTSFSVSFSGQNLAFSALSSVCIKRE